MSDAAEPTQVDVRAIAPRDRHPTIFTVFRSLATAEAMELVNDHDPWPLFQQFQAQVPGGFTWEYLERGPQTWRVRIARLAGHAGSPANGHCCGGGCGGGG